MLNDRSQEKHCCTSNSNQLELDPIKALALSVNNKNETSPSIEEIPNYTDKDIAFIIKKLGANVNKVLEYLRNDSEKINPDEYCNVMSVSSPEPLAVLRHICDKKTLNNLDDNSGKIYILTTDELKPDTYNYRDVLNNNGLDAEIIECGTISVAQKESAAIIENVLDDTFQINNTPGDPIIRESMRNVAIQKGASVVGLYPNSNKINCIYGNKDLLKEDQLHVDWLRIGGLNGLLPLYGINLVKETKLCEGRFTEYNVPTNDMEKDLNKIIMSSNVEIAGFGIKIEPTKKVSREKEVDAICIHNGRLTVIEAKQVELKSEAEGYSNMRTCLQELIKQFRIYDTKTNFIRKIGVLPISPADMIRTIKDRSKISCINEELRILKDLGAEIIGLSELPSSLSK